MRDQYKESPYYDYTEEFINKYDAPAFDSNKPLLDIELFAPMVKNVFFEAKNTIYETIK